MKETDPAVLLGNLRSSLEKIKTLIAWQELKRSEARPGEPPSFIMYDPTEMDLRNEYSFFIATHTELRSMTIERTNGKSTRRYTHITIELKRLEQQLHTLDMPAHMDWRP